MRSAKLIIFLLFSLLFARENPFEPVVTPFKQKVVKYKMFKQAKINLPSDARILKKIVFVYQNVRGDIKEKTLTINKEIDFHYPIIVTHKYKKFRERYASFSNLFNMIIKKNKILIITSDKKIRSFFLVKPFRIVIDFVRDADFLTMTKTFNTYLKKVVVGNHEGYYRVVMYFDTNYNYRIKKIDRGYEIDLF